MVMLAMVRVDRVSASLFKVRRTSAHVTEFGSWFGLCSGAFKIAFGL